MSTAADTAAPSADGWARSGPDRIERDGYRITKTHVQRLLHEPSPAYHAYAPGGAFLGAVGGDAERAKALCETHRNNRF